MGWWRVLLAAASYYGSAEPGRLSSAAPPGLSEPPSSLPQPGWAGRSRSAPPLPLQGGLKAPQGHLSSGRVGEEPPEHLWPLTASACLGKGRSSELTPAQLLSCPFSACGTCPQHRGQKESSALLGSQPWWEIIQQGKLSPAGKSLLSTELHSWAGEQLLSQLTPTHTLNIALNDDLQV